VIHLSDRLLALRLREVPGQLRPGDVVKLDAGAGEVLGEMSPRPSSRNEQHIWSKVQQPGERDLHRRRAQPYPQGGEDGIGEQPVPHVIRPAQRAEWHERDVLYLALREDVQGSVIGQG
jgi:hypothetical protein